MKKAKFNFDILHRPRRLRRTESLRRMVQETDLLARHLVLPVFITDQKKGSEIKSMPGVSRLNEIEMLKAAEQALQLGIPALALFPHITDSKKSANAAESKNPKGLLPQSIRRLKKEFPELTLITDVAMDPYSTDGHDGIVKKVPGLKMGVKAKEAAEVANDETLEILCEMALAQAEAGADIVAPSDMMDGRVLALRDSLDDAGYDHVAVLSYAAKYASSFYGPFREALDSAPRFGDKKTYQMNPANSIEALREVELDLAEGADIVMVKPALSYLDIITRVKAISNVPVAAYNVSGEYTMVKMAAKAGLADEKKMALEILTSMRRAGADIIFTYHALDVARWLK